MSTSLLELGSFALRNVTYQLKRNGLIIEDHIIGYLLAQQRADILRKEFADRTGQWLHIEIIPF